jgi:hypothetical protein
MKLTDLKIEEEFGNQVAPIQIRITHLPTGQVIVGNTGNEAAKDDLRNNLIAKLTKYIKEIEPEQSSPDDIRALREEFEAFKAAKRAGRPRNEDAA